MNEAALKFSEELTALFIKAINGDVSVSPTGSTWQQAYAGNCEFDIGGYKVVFFNDCNELDYTDEVIAPDSRAVDFDYWHGNGCDPLDGLNVRQFAAFESILEGAKP